MKLKLSNKYCLYKKIAIFIKQNGEKIHTRFNPVYRIIINNKVYEYSSILGITIISNEIITIYAENYKVKALSCNNFDVSLIYLARIYKELQEGINNYLTNESN